MAGPSAQNIQAEAEAPSALLLYKPALAVLEFKTDRLSMDHDVERLLYAGCNLFHRS